MRGSAGSQSDQDKGALAFAQFVEACEQAKSPYEVRTLLAQASLKANCRAFVLATEGPLDELATMAVRAHNLGSAQEQAFFASDAAPLFALARARQRTFAWRATALAEKTEAAAQRWWRSLARAGLNAGVAKPVRTAFTPALITLFAEAGELEGMHWVLRAGVYAFHQMQALQRPPLMEAEVLTPRERQCMVLAALVGMRPYEVARTLGVSINTVRTMRQRALGRLGARNQEEAVWRMMTTGQFFETASKKRHSRIGGAGAQADGDKHNERHAPK